jgi:hypothetical protein
MRVQADSSPAHMTEESGTIASAVGLRSFYACLRALLNASRVSAIASVEADCVSLQIILITPEGFFADPKIC